jgi:hypothetical protein
MIEGVNLSMIYLNACLESTKPNVQMPVLPKRRKKKKTKQKKECTTINLTI